MSKTSRLLILSLLAGSAVCFVLAPSRMPDSYSVMTHSISESAAQGVEGAWLARLGFLLFGFAVLALAVTSRAVWGRWGQLVHGLFGVAIIAAAAFSHMPWESVPYDQFEDVLHSVMAFAVGMSFTVGVILVAARPHRSTSLRILDGIAVMAALVIPLVMGNAQDIAGLAQRVMFAIALVWYGVETVRDRS